MHPPDEALMRAALALARRGLGRTAPNPTVAALVVSPDGVMIARGATAVGGRPHAEALALEAAGAQARGASLYVTLEPCAARSVPHYGPSCTQRILESGVARVIIGAPDPSTFAAGNGAKRLRDAGLEVVEHVLEDAASDLNLGHILRIGANRPMVTIKLAQTADGFAGTLDSRPLAITGEESRAFVHLMRAQADALITGIGTLLADDPRLDVRLPGMQDLSPMVVVADTYGRMPHRARVRVRAGRHRTLVATAAPEAVAAREASFNLNAVELQALDLQALEILAVPKGADGHLDLVALLAALAARGITRVMVEAGPRLAEAFAAAGLCDEFVLLTGSHQAGGGIPALGLALLNLMKRSEHAGLTDTKQLGADKMTRYRIKN